MNGNGIRGIFWIQALTTAATLPVLNGFGVRWWPPDVVPRWRPVEAPAADLGFAWRTDALLPDDRQLAAFGDLAGIALVLALLGLAIGCATLAMLLVRRGLERREELAVHAAVGARRRDLRGVAFHDLGRVLAAGAVVGAGVGLLLQLIVVRLAPESLVPPAAPVSLVGLLAIAAPVAAVLGAARAEVAWVVRRIRSPVAIGPSTRLARGALGAGYVAVLVSLLATTAVLARASADSGPEGTWAEARDTLVIGLPGAGEPAVARTTADDEPVAAAGRAHLETLAAARQAAPDRAWHLVSAGAVESLGTAERTLAECSCPAGMVIAPFRPHLAQQHAVTPGLFADLGIPVVRGREFTPDDGPGSGLVAIIDRRIEVRFNGVDPLGKLIRIGAGDDPESTYAGGVEPGRYWHRIVGVVEPPDPEGLAAGSSPIPGLYLSALQHPPSAAQILTRATAREGTAATEAPATRNPATTDPVARPDRPAPSIDERREVADALATAGIRTGPAEIWTLAERLATARRAVTGFGVLFAIAGLAAFLIAIRGLVDLVSLDIASRIPELGVRRAVGARRAHIRWLVRLDVVRLVAVGAALGTVGAVGLSVGLADRFAAVETAGLGTVALVVGVLAVVALLASGPPARRVGRVTPVDAIGAP